MSPALNELFFRDYAKQLSKYVTEENRELNTNVRGLDLLSILPMKADRMTNSVLSLGMQSYGQAAEFLSASGSSNPQQQNNNQAGANVAENNGGGGGFLGFEAGGEQEGVDFNFHFKMIIKLAIFLFVFISYFKGIYILLLLVLSIIYYWMKMKNTRVRRRRQMNQAAQNNQNAPDQHQNQDQHTESNQNRQKVELKGWDLTWARAKELFICFAFSLFPAWNLDIYIEERRNEYILPGEQTNQQNNSPPPQNGNFDQNLQGGSISPNTVDQSGFAANSSKPSASAEHQTSEERKEQHEDNLTTGNSREVELQRFESRDSVRNDALLD